MWLPFVCFFCFCFFWFSCLKKTLNAPRPSEYPPVWGKKCQNVSHSLYTYSKSMDPPGKVANPARGQLNREN